MNETRAQKADRHPLRPVPPERRDSRDSRDSDEVPLARLVPWLAFFVVLGIGVFLYFRYGNRVTPLLG